MRFSFLEYWPAVAKDNWKAILLILVVCGVLCGGYKGYNAYVSRDSGTTADEYQTEMNEYQEEIALVDEMQALLDSNIASEHTTISNNPMMQIDPFNCKYKQVSVVLAGNEDYQSFSVIPWVSEADANTIFDTGDASVQSYKNDLLAVVCEPITGVNLNGINQYATNVRVYDTELYDYEAAANNLKQFFEQEAKKDNVNVARILITSGGPYSQELYERQEMLRKNYLTMKDDSKKIQEYKRVLPKPAAPTTVSNADIIKTIIKYGIIGVVLGVIICTLLIWYIIRYGSYILNKEQMQDLFDLECLGEFEAENPVSNRLIDANLKAAKVSNILLLSETSYDQLSEMVNKLDCCKSCHVGHNIIDDVSAIDYMTEAEGIVVGITFGKTKIEDIQRTVARANHFGKQNIGYIVI